MPRHAANRSTTVPDPLYPGLVTAPWLNSNLLLSLTRPGLVAGSGPARRVSPAQTPVASAPAPLYVPHRAYSPWATAIVAKLCLPNRCFLAFAHTPLRRFFLNEQIVF